MQPNQGPAPSVLIQPTPDTHSLGKTCSEAGSDSGPESIYGSDEDITCEPIRTSYSGAQVHLDDSMFPNEARTRATTLPPRVTPLARLSIPNLKEQLKPDFNPTSLTEPARAFKPLSFSSLRHSLNPADAASSTDPRFHQEIDCISPSSAISDVRQSNQELPLIPFPTSPPSLPETESSLSISTVSSSLSSRLASFAPTYSFSTNVTADAHRLITAVLDFKAFQALLSNEAGRDSFRSWLSSDADLNRLGLAKLNRYLDETRADALVQTVRDHSVALYNLYHTERCETNIVVPKHVNEKALSTLSHLATLESGLAQTSAYLLKSLYGNEFQGWLHAKLIEEARISLGHESGPSSLDSFCLCNPRLPDNPVVMVSAGFVELTGYEPAEVIGRNCRFLQRNARRTSTYLRDAIAEQRPACELLLNQKKDGTPFYCLLNVVPLFDSKGDLMFWLGGQVKITGQICGSTELFEPTMGTFSALNVKREVQLGLPPDALCNESPRMRAHEEQLCHYQNRADQLKPVCRNEKAFISSTTLSRSVPSLEEPSVTSRSLVGQLKHALRKDPSVSNMSSSASTVTAAAPEPLGAARVSGSVFPHSAIEALGSAQGPFKERVSMFDSTYSQFFIFERHSHKLVYISRQCLGFFGLPAETEEDVLAPAVLHHNFIESIHAESGRKTKELRTTVINAIAAGHPVSCPCVIKWVLGVKPRANSLRQTFTRPSKIAYQSSYSCSLYLTPLLTMNNMCVVYTALIM